MAVRIGSGGTDAVAFLSFGWFRRRCLACRVPTQERVQRGYFWISGFSDGHEAWDKKIPMHFACDTTPEKRGP